MASYYDQLKVSCTATTEEIQNACDTAYNHWRLLVTHHDAQKALLAQQRLQQIDEIRNVLLNPEKRSSYDAKLGVGGLTSGLVDPNAPLDPSTIRGMAPTVGERITPPTGSKNTNQCPYCGSNENPPDARFCINPQCRKSLIQKCPNCNCELPWHFKVCKKCGADIDKVKLEIHQMIISKADEIQQLLDEKKWRKAKEELAGFEGLGDSKTDKQGNPRVPVICLQSQPEWQRGEALAEAVEVVEKMETGQIIRTSAIVYAVIGSIAGFILGISSSYRGGIEAFFQGLLFALMFTLVGALIGALCSWIYEARWGGSNGRGGDQALALLSILYYALILAFGVFIIGFFIIGLFMGGTSG